ncbi:PAS domain-containing sensor histidine kinase [Pseudomonas sp. A46]|uniref:sensor histidine kinase n=1 Tax=Metapseudomonas furukawaii TaxID=1149133 RepID=UPI000B49A5B3|nr:MULTISPECIES: ATP-binding protein [Pseudomonas]OWJ94178.1 PAS domain-containing sensor histidine kinase [Pseudomonas sp. A46]WAG79945.1 PAS domain-containing protein [Pseudomonas furukawaii]
MNAETLPAPSELNAQGRRIFRLYSLYRLLIGLTLVGLISSELDDQFMELARPELFRNAAWFYLIINSLIAVAVPRPRHMVQVFSLALVDVLILSCLFYAGGGTPSGVANLIVVSVAISNILLRGRIGLLVAAVATLALIYLTFYLSLSHPRANTQFVQAGGFGALCFAAALFLQGLSRRLQLSETLAEQRAADVASLEALNAQILERMRTGILVLDPRNRILLANNGALALLGRDELQGRNLAVQCPALLGSLEQWLANPTLRPQSLQAFADGPTLQPSFVPLPRGDQQNTLVFLDDISQIAQQAQQLKLASLGRLTAGIAHEIRNPLGAISHAAQLLQESEELDGPDRRLAQIIQDHSRRMNLVIENVLQLSRRRQSEPQLLDLKYWLTRFASEFRGSAAPGQTLHLHTLGSTLQTRMDPHQLTQVLTNLVQNGLRYSARKHGQGQVWLRLFRDPESDLPVLEVEDDGEGVPPEQVHNIFEPFFTTENKGTGLGLYLSRELCESNQARLDYKPREAGGSCFRITFAHPRKLS